MHKFCVWFLPVGRHFRLRCTVVIMTAFSSSENPTSGTLLLRIEQVTSVHSMIITWWDQAQLTICGGFNTYGGGGIWRLWTNRKSLWKTLKKYFLDSPWKGEPINGWSQLVAQIFPERENLLHFSIFGLSTSLPVWKRHFRTASGRKPPFSVDVPKLGLPHPGHNQSGSYYSLKLANNCTGSRINTEIVAKKWRKNMVLTHVAFDARGRGLGFFFCYQLIHLWKDQTKTNRMPVWNAL